MAAVASSDKAVEQAVHHEHDEQGQQHRDTHRTQPVEGRKYDVVAGRKRLAEQDGLGATVATLSFSVFQCLDLQDSLSAQVASILLLFPMHWNGSRFAGRTRAHGTLLGCVIALLIMLLLYDHHDLLPLVALLLWIAAMVCARWHMPC